MINATAEILFEFPLNEKTRTWLRLEFLLRQLLPGKPISSTTDALTFFRAIAELLDVLERGEIRADLLKDIERNQKKLQGWRQLPGVNIDRIDQLLSSLDELHSQLMAMARPGQVLREDKLISPVRQRLSIPGGCCPFDLPSLYLWLHLPQQQRDQQTQRWLASLEPLSEALFMILDLLRKSVRFQSQDCLNGFYQGTAEAAELLRLSIPSALRLYPQVSGHKSRYAVRFIPLESDSTTIPEHFEFYLACC